MEEGSLALDIIEQGKHTAAGGGGGGVPPWQARALAKIIRPLLRTHT